MSVQAQYLSNALFLNRNSQESDKATNFLIQTPPEEAFPNQIQTSYMTIFNNNVINHRKRVHDTFSSAPIDSLPKPQQTKMLDTSQLHHQSLVITGLKRSFDHQNRQHQTNHNPICSSILPDHIIHHQKQQQHKLNQLLHFQGEQLQRILSAAAEESLKCQLHTKQSELNQAIKRNAELEAQTINLQTQSNLWQAKARAHESTVESLQLQIHQAMSGIHSGRRFGVGDEERRSEVDDAESVFDDSERDVVEEGMGRYGCRVCGIRKANVVVLPCRHMCLCAVCDGDAAVCPYCLR